MYIESIQLKNFRNYEELNLSLDRNINIFYGNNGQGKTNILEAAYVGGTTKSHKGSKDREMIRFTEEEAHIRMVVSKKNISYRIDMHLKKNKPKGVAINGIPIKRARELFGIVNIVFFSPEDLNIIKNGPKERRRFIDIGLCQLDQIYMNDLSSYNHILNQRNKLLKELSFREDVKDTLDIWDFQMAEYGKRVIAARQKFVEKLHLIIQEIHRKLTGGEEELELLYEPDVPAENFLNELTKSREKDIRFKQTSLGPHRDDICVKVNGIDIRRYGSQGQQRTAALSLKLSETALLRELVRDTPILFLDDVLSELDSRRQNYLLGSIEDIQTLVTCTGLDEFVNNKVTAHKVFYVEKGKVSERKAI